MEKINVPINLIPEGKIPFEEAEALQLYSDSQEGHLQGRGGYLVTGQLCNTSGKTIQDPRLKIALQKVFNIKSADFRILVGDIKFGPLDEGPKVHPHVWQHNQVWKFTASFELIGSFPNHFNCYIAVSSGSL